METQKNQDTKLIVNNRNTARCISYNKKYHGTAMKTDSWIA